MWSLGQCSDTIRMNFRLLIMHKIKFLPILILTAIFALASCQTDDISTEEQQKATGGQTDVTLDLSVKSPTMGGSSTRAAVTENGTEGEFMRNWVVLIVRNDSIKNILQSGSYDGERSSDSRNIRLQNGTYSFYSFANIPLDSLGLTPSSQTLPQGFDDRAYHVDGNQMSISGFPNGIPMSNKQDVTITSATNKVSLSVIRMVAKVRVTLTNGADEPVIVHSLGIRDITSDPVGNTFNVKLLPGVVPTANNDNGKRNVNLIQNLQRTTFVDSIPTDDQTIDAGASRTFTFYVNESEASDADAAPSQGIGNHFVLEVRRGNTNATRGYVDVQYFTFDDWATMARNEIHVLPLTIQKYGLDLRVEPYTAIGVLPMYNQQRALYTINLGLYGHYDIVPRLRDYDSGVYYYITNNVVHQGITSSSPSGHNDITIDSLKLDVDANQVGIRYSQAGWGDGTDGSGETKHYPTVGWNETAAAPRIECITGNYTGWATYGITGSYYLTANSSKHIKVAQKFRIVNTYVDVRSLSKRH